MRITFLTRERQLPGTAMQNAAKYDAAHLASLGHSAQVLAVPDVDMFRLDSEPEVVIIEGAGWYPMTQIRKFVYAGSYVIVRVHAAPEFLYYEHPGVCATDYIRDAQSAGAHIGFVSPELAHRFRLSSLPINYPAGDVPAYRHATDGDIHIGCFGAIRPLKNHVGQLLAAARVRDLGYNGRRFYFHINSTRVEGAAHVVAELKALSKRLDINLVCRDWIPTAEFKRDVIPAMTVGMFASQAESFCLTAADFVSAGVPAVLSCHIPWALHGCATDTGSIADSLRRCLEHPGGVIERHWGELYRWSSRAATNWLEMLTKVGKPCLC